MHLEPEPKGPGLCQDALGFLQAEDARFTKDIAKLGQSTARDLWQHVLTQQPQVASPVRVILGRHGMSTKKGRHQLTWSLLVEVGNRLQTLDLIRQRQAITALDLKRRDAKAE